MMPGWEDDSVGALAVAGLQPAIIHLHYPRAAQACLGIVCFGAVPRVLYMTDDGFLKEWENARSALGNGCQSSRLQDFKVREGEWDLMGGLVQGLFGADVEFEFPAVVGAGVLHPEFEGAEFGDTGV